MFLGKCREARQRASSLLCLSDPPFVYFSLMRTFLHGMACLAMIGCGRSFTPADDAAIHQVMADQEQAWDRGDITGFMEGYADSVCFIGRRGKSCGKAAVTANYQRSYPDKAAMGDLTFDHLEILPAGADHAWCTGNWRLIRTTDTISGGFSLFWERKAEGWRILRDHTY